MENHLKIDDCENYNQWKLVRCDVIGTEKVNYTKQGNNDRHQSPDLDSYLDKAEQKRLKWNAYMRRYNERMHQERKERLSKVEIHFKNSTKLLDANEVNKLINDFVQINERIYNDHIECFDPSLTNEINSSTDDLIKYCDLLQNAIISILES